MKNAPAAISIAFIVLTVAFVSLGGSFDKQFWLAFLPGLMGNLAILALAIFVIDSIFKKERLKDEVGSKIDPELNFKFARDRFKGTNLAEVFYEKLMETENKEAFAEGFVTILSRETEAIS